MQSDIPKGDKKKKLTLILTSKAQFSHNGTNTHEISQYCLEVLLTYVEKESHSLLKDFFFMVGMPPVSVNKVLQPKDLGVAGYFTRMTQEEKDAINKKQVFTGLEKSDFAYWSKLLKSCPAAKPVAAPTRKTPKATAILPASQEDGLQYSLAKRISLLGEQTSRWPNPQPQIPTSLNYKMEFTKNYLNTAKCLQPNTTSQQSATSGLPSILKFGFEDYYGSITVIESNVMMKIVLFGTSKGMVKGVFLGRSADTHQPEQGVSTQRQKETDQQLMAAQEQNVGSAQPQPTSSDDYEMSLDMVEFVGHRSPITALSLKHDSSKFVSGSIDGQVRCWD